MLIAGTNLLNLKSIKRSNFVRDTGLLTLLWIESALTKIVGTAANHVVIARQEQRVGAATADLNYVLVKHIKSINSSRDESTLNLLMSKLPKVVAAPRVNMSSLNPLFPSGCQNCLLFCVPGDCNRKVLAARKPLYPVIFKGFNETRGTCSQ